jgi:hypothetical protein
MSFKQLKGEHQVRWHDTSQTITEGPNQMANRRPFRVDAVEKVVEIIVES